MARAYAKKLGEELMEKMLLKLARQLDSLDEASLSSLWSKYATITSRFEPTRRWEEACLVFSMIQAKRWKNQLFNYSWQKQRLPPIKDVDPGILPDIQFDLQPPANQQVQSKPCKILKFSSPKQAKGEEEES